MRLARDLGAGFRALGLGSFSDAHPSSDVSSLSAILQALCFGPRGFGPKSFIKKIE